MVLDLDFLAFVSQGLDEINALGCRQSSPKSRKIPDTDSRRSKVLDSLASTLVSKPQKQVIVIGAIIRSDGGFDLVVADNDDVPEGTVDHLRGIIADLRLTRSARPAPTESLLISSFLEDDSDPNSFDSLIVSLEHKVLRHSLLKLIRRFTKNDRHVNFINTAEDVLGSQQRTDRTDGERKELNVLRSKAKAISGGDGTQGGVDTEAGDPTLDFVLLVVRELTSLFDIYKPNSTRTQPRTHESLTMEQFEVIRCGLDVMQRWKAVLEREQDFCDKWDQYTHQRLKAKDALINSEKVDVCRWLSKTTMIRDHFVEIASFATSNALASDFVPHPRIRLLEKQTMTLNISVDRKALLDVLKAAGCRLEEYEPDKVDRFLDRLARVHQMTLTEDRKLVINIESSVHCECKVLAALHLQSAAPLIGVSKLSCAFCDLYLPAYRDAVRSNMCTTGCHDRSFA